MKDFKIESSFQDFFSCFPGMTTHPEVIDLLRDFFYAGAGNAIRIQVDRFGRPPDELKEMYADIVAYAKAKEDEYTAEMN